MKHIVIDGRVIETSTGRYIQRIVEGINDDYASSSVRYTLLVPSAVVNKWQQRLPHFAVAAADYGSYGIKEQTLFAWQLYRLKADLVHFAMPQQPFLYFKPSVTTIHDMILVRYDNIGKDNPLIYKLKKMIFRTLLHTVLRRAKAIISPTNYVRRDLANFFGERFINKMYVTPLAGEIPGIEPVPIKGHGTDSFLLYIGNMFPYKNVKQVVLAYRELKLTHPDLKLFLAGKKDEFADELEAFTLREHIEDVYFLGFITDNEKRWALQHAQAFVTASLAEGFCMPLLEAMIEGCPVAASNASCIPEVVGNAAILFDPKDTNSQVAAIEAVLSDPEERANLIARGRARAATFSWQRTVSQTHGIHTKSLLS